MLHGHRWMESWPESESLACRSCFRIHEAAVLIKCLLMQFPNDWLKKHLVIEDLAVSVTAHRPLSRGEPPLVRTQAIHLAVLAPVFAVLADRAVAGQTTAVIDVVIEPVLAKVSSQQVAWLKTFAQMIPTVLAARGMHSQLDVLLTCISHHPFDFPYSQAAVQLLA